MKNFQQQQLQNIDGEINIFKNHKTIVIKIGKRTIDIKGILTNNEESIKFEIKDGYELLRLMDFLKGNNEKNINR